MHTLFYSILHISAKCHQNDPYKFELYRFKVDAFFETQCSRRSSHCCNCHSWTVTSMWQVRSMASTSSWCSLETCVTSQMWSMAEWRLKTKSTHVGLLVPNNKALCCFKMYSVTDACHVCKALWVVGELLYGRRAFYIGRQCRQLTPSLRYIIQSRRHWNQSSELLNHPLGSDVHHTWYISWWQLSDLQEYVGLWWQAYRPMAAILENVCQRLLYQINPGRQAVSVN